MMKALFIIIQISLLILAAPLVSGVIKKIKSNMRMRKGASVLQPYYDLAKLFIKDEVISKDTSWIFRITPFIVLGSTIAAGLLVPVLASKISLNHMGDFLMIIFIFALGRFFLCLAALDAGSAFGGMGSSREMFISSLVEPVALLSIFAVSMSAGSTSIEVISGIHGLRLSSAVAAISFFIVIIAETSRIPVDNQETHLELTMIHEAMALEYSGPSLALIELASHIKQIVFFSILANVVLPWGLADSLTGFQPVISLGIYFAKIAALALIVSIIEISMAKMRLFRVVDLLSFAIALSMMAVIISAGGM